MEYSFSIGNECELKDVFPGIFYTTNVESYNGDNTLLSTKRFLSSVHELSYPKILRNAELFYKKTDREKFAINSGKIHQVNSHQTQKTLVDCQGKLHKFDIPKILNRQGEPSIS